nr:potassium transporter TrkG [Robertmurraya siralis]
MTFIREKQNITVGRRAIKEKVVFRSLAILTISASFIFLAIVTLNITEPLPFLKLLFEVISAFGTVGLSMGFTGDISTIGKLIIIFVMFFGKLGPLTLAFSLAQPEIEKIKYPSEDVLTG